MPYVKKMYVTEIKEEFEGDAFFLKLVKIHGKRQAEKKE